VWAEWLLRFELATKDSGVAAKAVWNSGKRKRSRRL